ncbi:MAG: carbon storage regulator [Gemmataceae bacterium]|nr:carbon storage regulator [Gemmataceae bacterium]
MLITRRRIGEKIVIGKDITITVLDISRDQVKVGIEAPREVPVYRLEYMPEEARPKCEVKS